MSQHRTLYKVTDENSQTYGGCQWGPGVTHIADGEGELCTEHWIHAYPHPLVAVFMNPIDGNYDAKTMKLWEAQGVVGATDHGLKVGCTTLTTVRRMEVPRITAEQRVAAAILCAKLVYDNAAWNSWADGWLSGADRSEESAEDTAMAAWAAAWGPACAEVWAARGIEAMARAAAETALAARPAWAVEGAAWAVAASAMAAKKYFGLSAIIRQAIAMFP